LRRGAATEGESVGAVIGREAELKALERLLDAMPAAPAGVVVEGEPGIGKTILWLEGVRAAAARGYRVLEARPAESETQLPYAALADLVGGVFDETRALLPPPQERALAVALLRDDANDAADARTIGTALVGTLTAVVHEQPVLVAVDDAQWLDPASGRALAFALRRSPPGLGVLLTRRAQSGERLPLGLDAAFPEGRLERVVPGPLSVAALHHLIARRLGNPPARPALARIAATSAGNPFFALELTQALAHERGERTVGDPLPVPHSLQELVAARVHGLSAAAQEAALVAAALSRPTVATVERALGPDVDASRGLAEAEEAEVLVSTRGRLRFTHPLLASVVYGSVSDERRRRLHGRLADVVSDPDERARHRAQSTLDPDAQTAGELRAPRRSPWADRARSERARVGLRHRSPHELTASERHVAELAARGLTNRQVAEAAFMSPKTVEANLSRIYRKLGIRSRAELGARIATDQRDAETHT
jgi:DNA-binding CsgD family transcriptional regulator